MSILIVRIEHRRPANSMQQTEELRIFTRLINECWRLALFLLGSHGILISILTFASNQTKPLMLKLLLLLFKPFAKEPCSLQREVLNRLAKKRSAWDHNSAELLELYDHMATIVRRAQTTGISWAQKRVLLKYPASALNFFNDKQVPINDLERFRSSLEA